MSLRALLVVFPALVLVALASSASHSKTAGIGVGGGAWLTGLTAKKYLADDNAIQGIIGLTRQGWAVETDYRWRMGRIRDESPASIAWGLGVGFGALTESEDQQFAAGLLFLGVGEIVLEFSEAPIEVVLDYRPAYRIGGLKWGGDFTHVGGALRYFF